MSRAPLLRLCLLLLLLCAALAPARADTPITLWKSFDGRVNFAGTQVTLRTGGNTDTGKKCNGDGNGNNGNCNNGNGNNGNNGNGNNGNGNGNNGNNGNGNNGNGNGNNGNGNNKVNACTVTAATTNRSASLALPAGATVLSAQLYWAGSGPSDSTVSFEGLNVTASRKYSSATVGGGFDYFGGAADVTAIVKGKGSGTYNFSGLTVKNGEPWCASQAVLGGFSLLVVYTHPSEPERVLNIYEGFQHLQNGEVVLKASNFRWRRPVLPVEERVRVGHITWEGDPTLADDGERLSFQGKELSDALNPAGNQFNSRSNINNDGASHGIDFDAYDTTVVLSAASDGVATTTYRTGQDMVLLNVEVLLVPTIPVSDLSIALARGDGLEVGRHAGYTVTVTNNGPYTEAGPVTVSSALPAGMSHVSGSGTGWTCSAGAPNASCTYKEALAPGASAPPLLLTAAVHTTGEKTVTVTVKGTEDDKPGNNSASDTATAIDRNVSADPPAALLNPHVFTDSVCVAGIAIGAPGQTCKPYGAATVGGAGARIYLTATSGGIPAAPSATETKNASLQFAIECLNPAGEGKVGASYGGTPIPACARAGQPAWSAAASVAFPPKAVSVALDFVYNDVGQVKLSLKESGSTASTEAFVSAPLRIEFKSIRHGMVRNPGHTAPGSSGFAPAGAPLKVEIGARLAGTAGFAPNFGNEKIAPNLLLTRAAIDGVKIVSAGELSETGKRAWKDGIMTTEASWSEVGAIDFVTGLLDAAEPGNAGSANRYLGVPVQGSAVAVGRFYPAYFTTVVTGSFDCPDSLPAAFSCPRDARGAVYSEQPFDITAQAFNANNERLRNFTGAWFRPVTLHAVDASGGKRLAANLVPGNGEKEVVIAATTALVDPLTGASADRMQAAGAYRLAVKFSNAQPRATDLSAPTAVYVRAVATETVLTPATPAASVEISSLRSGEVSDEDGVLVLNGRVKVPNALGTDILRTPLGLRAEYWAGAARGWLANPEYADPVGSAATALRPLVCSAGFASSGTVCDPALVGASAPQTVRMARGTGVLWLRAPGKLPNGAARNGSVTLQFDGWPWLPSTIGRVNYGSHRSPVIYVREMYF